MSDIWSMPSITFFILIQASRRLDFTEEQTNLVISNYPHMEESGQEKIIRHYERLEDYLFDVTENVEGMEDLKRITNG